MSASPLVSILIVAFRSQDLIDRCLDAIPGAARKTPCEILLVDNGDGATAALVAEHYPDVRIIPSRGNIGFAAGNNLLAKEARGKYLLLLNPDMFLHADAVDELVAGAERHPEAAAWGGISVDANGVPDTGNAIGEPSVALLASAAIGRSAARRNEPIDLVGDEPADILSGGLVMIDHSRWLEAGGFDERFFLYCEEVDLFRRLRDGGYSLWRIGRARGQHSIAHGQSLSARRLLYLTAGTVEFLRKHKGKGATLLGVGLLWLAAAERVLAGKLIGNGNARLAELASGYRLVALHPGLWMRGYDERRGLNSRLDRLEKRRQADQ